MIVSAMTSKPSIVPKLYNTGEDVRHLAMCFIIITAVMMPVNGIVNCAYFTLRCGGKTLITYSWGNQYGKEFLALAEYDGSSEEFLKSFFE